MIQSEDVIIHAIGHSIRREILEILISEPRTFSELLNYFDISTGKLNYHLNQIKGFITKNNENNYEITPLGLKTLEILKLIRDQVSEKEQTYLKEAYISQKNGSKSLVLQGINIGIGGLGFIIAITIFLFVVFLSIQNTPIFIWPIIITMLIGESIALIWVIQLKRTAPSFIERVVKHLKENS